MKNKMEEFDQSIKETLSKDEIVIFNGLEEQNLLGMLTGLFKGKNAWLLMMSNIMTVIFFIFLVYNCINFFSVDTTEELIKWGFGSMVFLVLVTILKLFAWMQMDKNAILREMKKMELQIMSLSKKLDSK